MTLQSYLDFVNYCQNLSNNFLQGIAIRYLTTPDRLFLATKYSLLSPGKRLRAVLVYAIADLLEIDLITVNAAAAAVELVHCYSLVHDDLPAMDNDDLRRGKPSCHKAFDEATAILVGDGLQALAFKILSDAEWNPFDANIRSNMALKLAESSGFSGMVYGQAKDIESENKIISLKDLEIIHEHKTGSLINCCIELAILASNKVDFEIKNKLLIYGKHLGLIFQIKDDILETEQQTEILGKSSRSDQKSNKATFVSILGIAGAKQQLAEHYNLAVMALQSLIYDNQKIQLLHQFAEYFKNRIF